MRYSQLRLLEMEYKKIQVGKNLQKTDILADLTTKLINLDKTQ